MFEAPKLDEVGKGLIEAADLIKIRGWYNGTSPHKFFGTVCAVLAICEVFYNSHAECAKAFARLAKHVGVAGRENIPAWNDRNDAETVMKALREAAYNK